MERERDDGGGSDGSGERGGQCWQQTDYYYYNQLNYRICSKRALSHAAEDSL